MSSNFNIDAKPFVPTSNAKGGNNRKGAQGERNRGRGRGRGGGGRGRGGGSNNNNRNSGHKEPTPVADPVMAEYELFSQSTVNKRGEVDISHLLDFSRPSQHHHNRRNSQPRRRPPKRSTASSQSDPIADKETYVNISCKFVLDPRGSYKELENNPDKNVPMENVMRILAQPSSCPICLEDVPEAPRMLECGHIMCYPCLFRFLTSENIVPAGETKPKKHKQCPLCFDRVNRDKARPVSFVAVDELFDTPREDTDVVLRLMFRPMGSLLALPKDTDDLKAGVFSGIPNVDELPDISRYSRLIMGSEKYALSQYQQEIDQLMESKEQNRILFDDSGKWYDQAITTIREIMNILDTSKMDDGSDHVHDPSLALHPPVSWSDNEEPDINGLSLKDNDKDHSHQSHHGSQHGHEQEHSLVDAFSDDSAYFFYQTGFDTVTKYFLAPLDVKILRAAYGAYCAFPSTLLLKVTNVLYGTSVTPELRKRMKYLSHLPLHTPVAFLECEWRGIISDKVLQPFNKELQARRKRKKDKDRKEERDRRRYQREEEEHLRAELLTEEYYSPVNGTPSPPKSSAPSKVPPAAAATAPTPPSVANEQQSLTSFAAIASGEAQSARDQDQLNSLLSSAPRKGKGKKLVLMANSGGMK